MNSRLLATRLWRLIAVVGGLLIVLGLSAFYVDEATHNGFDIIEHNYDAFGLSILIGVIFSFIGCIGWAFVKMNAHGVSMIPVMLILPATALAVVLLIMAAIGHRNTQ